MAIGERTIPGTIDDLANRTPEAVWATYPASPEEFDQGDLVTVTFANLANAINRLAWYLKARIGQGNNGEVLCYVGPSDIRYFILACAACKCGWTALFSSPRNNLDAHLALFDATECRWLLTGAEQPRSDATHAILEARNLSSETIPTLEELLRAEPVNSYPWCASFEELSHQSFLVLHTSGSTGLPKPVIITHGLIATIDCQQLLADIDGRKVTAHEWANRPMYTALPPFHSAGINFFAFSVFQGTQLVLGPSDKPPSVGTLEKVLELGIATAGVIAPSILAEVASEPDVLPKLSQWSSVAFGGAPLAKEAGDAIWKHTKVLCLLGSTETFNIPELVPQQMDEWQYHNFHQSLSFEMRPTSDGLGELVFIRNDEAVRHQGAFSTFPDQKEYSMKDLYEPHATKSSGLWKYRGRLDDILVLSNGEKFNPADAEEVVSAHPEVRAALIVGEGKEQPVLLIEPAEDAVNLRDAQYRRQSITQIIDEANHVLPAHAQIHESHVKALESTDVFLRSAKGQIRRVPTTKAIADVIEEVYESADTCSAPTSHWNFDDPTALMQSLQATISADILGGRELGTQDNIFACGFDSLRTLQLLRTIKASMKADGRSPPPTLTAKTIYQHATLAGLSRHLCSLLDGGDVSDTEQPEEDLSAMQHLLDAYVERLSRLEPVSKSNAADSPHENSLADFNPVTRRGTLRKVILTGSTGSLGSYILHALIHSPSVDRIICLNRQGSTAAKQTPLHESRGLSQDFSRVIFLETDLSQHHLGLDLDTYQDLVRGDAHIIHNAWPVNFNLPLSAFEQQLEGCYNLIQLAHSSTEAVSMSFLSSVGAANNWTAIHPDSPVSEAKVDDFRIAEPMGYAQSKCLAECIFASASDQLALPITVYRLGQIAGPVKSQQGMWNVDEWFPSLLRSCKTVGSMPQTLGAMDRLDWLPVDTLGDMLAKMSVAALTNTNGAIPREETPSLQERLSTAAAAISSVVVSTVLSPMEALQGLGEDGKNMSSPHDSAYSSYPPTPPTQKEGPEDQQTAFLHFVNPNVVQWRDIAPAIQNIMKDQVELVPYEEWLTALEAADESGRDEVPAARLLDFFNKIGAKDAKRPVFDTTSSTKQCSELAKVPAVSVDWIELWMRQWGLITAESSKM